MRSDTRQMHLTATISGFGHHPAGWRASRFAAKPGLPPFAALAQLAETGMLDAVLFGPAAGGPDLLMTGGADALQLDPLPLIATLIARTRGIGLGASTFVDRGEPFHVARAFAVSDRLSLGRTAWLADTVGADHRPEDFAHGQPPRSRAEQYDRAAEFIDVVTQLWDSWEDDAIVADKATSLFADAGKIHPINHRGPWFQVRGPLTAIRPVQGRPIIVMRDGSPEGMALAAAKADMFIGSPADRAAAESIAAELRKSGRGGLRILADITTVLAPTAEAARQRAAALDAMIAAPLTGLRFVGTPAGLADLMAEWFGAGACDGFNIQPSVLPDDLAPVVETVVPELQKRGLFRTAYPGTTLRDSLGLPHPVSQFAAA